LLFFLNTVKRVIRKKQSIFCSSCSNCLLHDNEQQSSSIQDALLLEALAKQPTVSADD